jgi:hypothetical protein
MAQQGGYRQPANPAPVSGPGPMSQRTDRGQPIRDPEGLPYGDNRELRTVQGAAPMASAGNGAAPAAPEVPLADMSPSLFDQTNYPERPVTTGMPFGPGPGSEALGAQSEESPMARARLINALPTLLRAAELPGTSPEFKTMVSMLRRASLG